MNASNRKHNLLWGIRRSIRYHDRRKSFFEWCHTMTTLLAILLGSATFFSLMREFVELQMASAALVTVTAALDLVLGFSRKAWLHDDLKRRFLALEIRTLREEDTASLEEERLRIEADEPAIMEALDILCHNDLLKSGGYEKSDGNYLQLPWWQSLTANFINWSVHH